MMSTGSTDPDLCYLSAWRPEQRPKIQRMTLGHAHYSPCIFEGLRRDYQSQDDQVVASHAPSSTHCSTPEAQSKSNSSATLFRGPLPLALTRKVESLETSMWQYLHSSFEAASTEENVTKLGNMPTNTTVVRPMFDGAVDQRAECHGKLLIRG